MIHEYCLSARSNVIVTVSQTLYSTLRPNLPHPSPSLRPSPRSKIWTLNFSSLTRVHCWTLEYMYYITNQTVRQRPKAGLKLWNLEWIKVTGRTVQGSGRRNAVEADQRFLTVKRKTGFGGKLAALWGTITLISLQFTINIFGVGVRPNWINQRRYRSMPGWLITERCSRL